MERRTVRFTGKKAPAYQSEGAAGADLRAELGRDVVLLPGERVLVPTGLHLEIPPGLEGQVRPRSGLAARHGVTVLNSPGTIDSDYRGEVQVILVNQGKDPFVIHNGDRIAQIVFCAVERVAFQAAEGVGDTERGDGGFGSTGI
jgi:dUTP pyrophosphatase